MTDATYLDELAHKLASRRPRKRWPLSAEEQAIDDARMLLWFERKAHGCMVGIQEAAKADESEAG